MHSGEKSSKCNRCNFASSQASDLRRHLKTHSGWFIICATGRAMASAQRKLMDLNKFVQQVGPYFHFSSTIEEKYAEGLPPHFHFHNDRSLSSNTTIFLQNHDEAYHFLPRGWMSPELKICCNVFTLSLSQWPEIVFREKWLAPCVNLKQTSSSTDLCGRD